MWNGWPAGSCPGISVRPSTLIAKMTIRMISGARIRRMMTKIVAEAWSPEPSRARQLMCGRRGPRPRRRRTTAARRPAAGYSWYRLSGSNSLRWNDTVSVTSRTTETRLASSAPPDSDTTLAIACPVTPSVETWAA